MASKENDKYVSSSSRSEADIPGAPVTAEETEERDEAIINAVQQDPRFSKLTDCRQIRFAHIMRYYKDDGHNAPGHSVLDFSDNAPFRVKGSKFKFIPCKNGNLVSEEFSGGDGRPSKRHKLRNMTAEEAAAQDAPDSPCDCELCKKRRENGFEKAESKDDLKPEVGLRSGMKRKWDEKYGEGRIL
ncbi:hypothetical protein C8A01DRAFT_32370 [Parachaetomium inaequale]|uniref:Uncharacterized protein n=1 Tax=Parachaetomium inaequale TaxID=2588326 RepID=A0AAN6SV65_9PEZI|nr:hypothetical protein C8A01DRAFT_32370 [Parachaetomium inaequale]